MPGPVSDSYDSEFGTSANAAEVREALFAVRAHISENIGDDVLQDIIEISERYNNLQTILGNRRRAPPVIVKKHYGSYALQSTVHWKVYKRPTAI